MQVLAEGAAEYLTVDPDAFRAYVRDHKQLVCLDLRKDRSAKDEK